MSERTRLETGAVGEMQALGAFGRPVHSLYAQLRAVVEARLSPRHAGMFAEPVMHSDNRIDWYAPAAGTPLRLAALAPDQAAAARATLHQLAADLTALSATLTASASDSDQAMGHLIALALSTPDDSHIFVLGDQPVLTFWGFARRGGGSRTTPLYGYGGQATQPAAAAPMPAAAAAVAVRGSPLPWLMWSFAALLLAIAILLMLKALAGVDVPGLAWLDGPGEEPPPRVAPAAPVQVADAGGRTPVDDSALIAAREEERGLRAQLAALEAEYDGARAACPIPQDRPAITPIPDRDPPAVIPDRDVTRLDGPDRVVPLPDRDPDVATLEPDDPLDPAVDELLDPAQEAQEPDVPAADEPAAEDAQLGAPLTIDEAARAAQDLSPLEGEWRTGRSLMDQGSADPLEIELSFDAAGRGRTTIRLEDGVTCSAPAEAAYNGPDALVITELDHPACSDGTEFERSEIVCLIDQDGGTICEGAQAGGGGYPVGLYEAGGQ